VVLKSRSGYEPQGDGQTRANGGALTLPHRDGTGRRRAARMAWTRPCRTRGHVVHAACHSTNRLTAEWSRRPAGRSRVPPGSLARWTVTRSARLIRNV